MTRFGHYTTAPPPRLPPLLLALLPLTSSLTHQDFGFTWGQNLHTHQTSVTWQEAAHTSSHLLLPTIPYLLVGHFIPYPFISGGRADAPPRTLLFRALTRQVRCRLACQKFTATPLDTQVSRLDGKDRHRELDQDCNLPKTFHAAPPPPRLQAVPPLAADNACYRCALPAFFRVSGYRDRTSAFPPPAGGIFCWRTGAPHRQHHRAVARAYLLRTHATRLDTGLD